MPTELVSKDATLNAYPNPFDNKINIQFIDNWFDNVKLILFDTHGHLMCQSNFLSITIVIYSVEWNNLLNLSAEIYHLSIETKNENKYVKVVKN